MMTVYMRSVLLRHQHGDDPTVAPAASGSDRSYESQAFRYSPNGVTQSAVVIARWRNTPSWACDEEEEGVWFGLKTESRRI